MDVPVPAPSQCVVGLTIPLPEPWATQVRLVRAGVGDPLARVVPPHVTLLPPTAVEREGMPAIAEHVERVAAATAPFVLRARGVGTFRPVSPVVYVALTAGAPQCDALQRVLRVRGLARTIGEVTPEVSAQLTFARTDRDGASSEAESPYAIGRTPDVPRSGSFGMPGAAAPTGLAQPRARKARTTTPTEKKEESK